MSKLENLLKEIEKQAGPCLKTLSRLEKKKEEKRKRLVEGIYKQVSKGNEGEFNGFFSVIKQLVKKGEKPCLLKKAYLINGEEEIAEVDISSLIASAFGNICMFSDSPHLRHSLDKIFNELSLSVYRWETGKTAYWSLSGLLKDVVSLYQTFARVGAEKKTVVIAPCCYGINSIVSVRQNGILSEYKPKKLKIKLGNEEYEFSCLVKEVD